MDLHPSGADESYAYAVGGGVQAGEAVFGGVHHAALWSGTSGSYLDLSPAGATQASAQSVSNGKQAGSATINGASHAGVWGGSAASWVDLHLYLPLGYAQSYGQSVWTDGTTVKVVGSAFNSTTGQYEALMWVYPPPPTFTQGTVVVP